MTDSTEAREALAAALHPKYGVPDIDDADAILAALSQSGYEVRKREEAHPVLVKYGLEGMGGDPLEVLDRHLTNGAAATLGAQRRLTEMTDAALVELRGVVERIAFLTGDVPAAHGDPESFYRQQFYSAVNIAALVLADTSASATAAAERLREDAWLATRSVASPSGGLWCNPPSTHRYDRTGDDVLTCRRCGYSRAG